MAKFIKMAIYGEPGVGKSTFAAKAPKPFFITTDGNYEYLEDFCGSKPEDHIQCYSWKEMKAAFNKNFDNYETIVVDLVEDSYMWAENEFCTENSIKHISDLGYGKGYGILSNEFFIEYQKLLALPKNIILIFHGVTEILKDRRGIEYTRYGPSKLIREKIVTQIEGRVRFFVRAFAETTEDSSGRLVTSRYLSLSPDGMTEYGITRGLSGDIPQHIALDWDVFYEIASRTNSVENSTSIKTILKDKPIPSISKKEPAKKEPAKPAEPVKPEKIVNNVNPIDEIKEKLQSVLNKTGPDAEDPEIKTASAPEVKKPEPETQPAVVPQPTVVAQPTANVQPINSDDKLAAIRAKMAALKNNK